MKKSGDLLQIQVDSREKAKAIQKIIAEFEKQGVGYYVSKMYAGDYMNLDNPRLVIDRKQNLTELCSNVCQQHERFRNELVRAKEHGIKLIILCEHGKGITTLSDVVFWDNPRRHKRIQKDGKWQTIETKATTGQTLYNILSTLERKYDCKFLFCDKKETGKRIIEILGGMDE